LDSAAPAGVITGLSKPTPRQHIKSTEQLTYTPTRTNVPSSPDCYDQRLLWFRDVACSQLALPSEEGPRMFVECLERTQRYNLAELMDFLDGNCPGQSTVMFYLVQKVDY
jgi:hypothetical protein